MIKGILFDKDGTLIDFSLWRNAGINTIQTILTEYNLNDDKLNKELQKAIGIKEKGVEPFGALAYSSHEKLAYELYFILNKYVNIDLEKFESHVVELLRKEVLRDDVEFKEIVSISSLYEYLKSNKIKMGMATADSKQSAMHLINKLNLNDSFDFVGSYDGTMKIKPHKDMCMKFCSMYNLEPGEVAIVGDSYNDMLFALNSGAIGVGVLSGVSSKINLKDVANVIVPSVESLFDRNVLETLDEKSYEARELRTA
ncbi:MAG: HAD family hydrolase [Tissierellia bacterium]|jgi:HAD superfamily hydrolase (TIGR01549 family)|nr:HAD family hydrolase [Tissierellia bacterium]MDD3227090.1 HAD family hydrolase [Tissierellia bacterium]MDD3751502.1 HAD family hydrolase [Tissierellia bacterium]MDD4046079.1 HAD family hydrolase [Tissierellia bacterium]MDD4677790.1 HAD family hydrolase [Tissierellia bacterium]